MKRFLLTLTVLLAVMRVSAQKMEITGQLYSGFFHFAGRSATSTSMINQASAINDPDNYTNNPYGRKTSFGYGAAIQAQMVSKGGFIVGLQSGYEVLKSRVIIDRYFPIVYNAYPVEYITYQDPSFAVKGHTGLQKQFINVNPYIGYRLGLKKVKVDIMPGLDIGFNTGSYDKGEAKDDEGRVYKADYKRDNNSADVRLKLGLAASYGRYGIFANYAHGLTNYLSGALSTGPYDVGDGGFSAHSELLRIGLSYRLN